MFNVFMQAPVFYFYFLHVPYKRIFVEFTFCCGERCVYSCKMVTKTPWSNLKLKTTIKN